jgi:hypothetical protein
MKFYKKHIAIFFTILFLVSQFGHVLHTIVDHHTVEKEGSFLAEYNPFIASIQSDNASINQSIDNCLLCLHHQNLKLYSSREFVSYLSSNEIDSQKIAINYNTSSFDAYLLAFISLRAPPSLQA